MSDLLQQLRDWETAVPSVQSFAFHLLLAFVLSKPLAWVYARTHQGTSYSRSFVQSLVMLSLIVTMVMLAIGDSLARAFGLFGALALIRFRTPIKDSRDTVFLFLAVAIGIAVGVQNVLLAVTGTAIALATAAYLHVVRFGERVSHDAVLRFAMPALGNQEDALRRVLRHYCSSFALVSLRDSRHEGAMDFSYQLRLLDPASSTPLLTDVRAIPGALDVNLLLQNEDVEV